ncbi:MAG: rod-binding protein [Alphaproteobacteria bacterium]
MNILTQSSPLSALTNASQASVNVMAQKARAEQKDMDIQKIETTAREFESVFIAEMMKPMFEGIETGGLFGGGKGEEIFRNMMLDEYGKMVAQTGGIGLADQVKQQMILMQEQANNGT